MNLKDFVSETLVSIVDGVKDAQNKAEALGANINPGGLMRNSSENAKNSILDQRTNNYAQSVVFDIAITAEDTANGGAKIKVLSVILGGELGGEKSTKNAIASRVQFSVPVLFPTSNINDPEARLGKQSTTILPNPMTRTTSKQ